MNNLFCLNMFRQLSLILIIFVSSQMLAQQTLVVTNLNDTGVGSLRQTINGSLHGDTITFNPSLLVNGSATIFLNSEIGFNRSLTIRGLFSGNDSLFISGNDSSSIFYINGNTFALPVRVHLESLVLKNAIRTETDPLKFDVGGGAIYAEGLEYFEARNVKMRNNRAMGVANGGAIFLADIDTVYLKNCTFFANNTDTVNSPRGGLGGAVRTKLCNVIVDSCVFKANISSRIGGGISSLNGSLKIVSSLFMGNRAGNLGPQNSSLPWGGAVSAYSLDSLFVDGSSFVDNRSHVYGGALYIKESNSLINKSIFKQNSTRRAPFSYGGAVAVPFSQGSTSKVVFANCTLDSNHAQKGGAIFFSHQDLTIRDCLLNDNYGDEGGAIYGQTGSLLVRNSTLYDNNATSEGSDCYLSADMTCIINKSSLLNTSNVTSMFFGYPLSGQVPTTGRIHSSIIVNGGNSIHNSTANITSDGYNIFSGNPSFAIATDTSGHTLASLQLLPLGNYGGCTECMPPMLGSSALNAGDPLDFTLAQNGPVFGLRDCGAAEASVTSSDTAELCTSYQWRGMTLSSPGTYVDTLFNSNSIDSIVFLNLEKPDSLVQILNGKLVAPSRDGITSYQWIICNTPITEISGAKDSIFQPSVNGNYAVIMSRLGCIDTSDCISFNQISIREHKLPASFVNFYPNPSNGSISIKIAENIKLEVLMIYDLQGRPLASHKISNYELSLGNLPPGVFILEWHTIDGNVQKDRLVIE